MATTTYEPIQTYTLGSAASSVTFGSGGTIPSTYTDLVLVANPIMTGSADYKWYVNGDNSSGLYSQTRLTGDGSSATSSRTPNANFLYLDAVTPATGSSQAIIMNFQNYANTLIYKTVLIRYSGAGSDVSARVGLWRNTNSITSITISTDSSTFAAGSTFTLYGIANANIGAPKAQGGVITYDSTYFYHTFGASGTFTPQQSLTADVLVVAGGGGGGARRGGGGGAGGLLAFTSQSFSATGYAVIVGGGGAGGTSGTIPNGAQGGDSSFGALTNVAGGGGATGDGSGTVLSINGGSGGGSTGNYSGGTAVSGQGNIGGSGSGAAPNYGAGGGGGKGAAGTAGISTVGGAGGVGVNTYSSWGIATGTGQNVSGTVYYAGGGGGAVYDGGTAGSGGFGGGGAAGAGGGNNAGIVGSTNTGGGGGGSSILSVGNAAAGNGGSGVVIIRYLKA